MMKVKGKRGSLTHSSGFVVSLQRLQAAVKAEKQRCEKGGEHNLKRPLFATNTGKFLGSERDSKPHMSAMIKKCFMVQLLEAWCGPGGRVSPVRSMGHSTRLSLERRKTQPQMCHLHKE